MKNCAQRDRTRAEFKPSPVQLRVTGQHVAAVSSRKAKSSGSWRLAGDHFATVSFGSASRVTSILAPGFRATASPVGEVIELAMRIYRKRKSAGEVENPACIRCAA